MFSQEADWRLYGFLAFCIVPKLTDLIVDCIYMYCACADLVKSDHSEVMFKSTVIVLFTVLEYVQYLSLGMVEFNQNRTLGFAQIIAFVPANRGIPEVWVLLSTYWNLVLFIIFHIFSWICIFPSICDSYLTKLGGTMKSGVLQSKQLQAPMIFVIMPCYREREDILMGSIYSVLNSNYPKHCIGLMVSFDGLENRRVFNFVVKSLDAKFVDADTPTATACVRNVSITITLFEHRGKKACQVHSLKAIQSRSEKQIVDPDETYVMLMDSDTRMLSDALQTFANMTRDQSKIRRVDAVTSSLGVTDWKDSWTGILEQVDFLRHGLLLEISASSLGSVLCACGTHTFLRLSVFQRVCDAYCDTIASSYYDYWLQDLGDDRWLTHLISSSSKNQNRLVYMSDILCTTMTVEPLWPVLTQRRRWLLATISSDAFANLNYEGFISNPKLWSYRLASQTIRPQDIYPLVLALIYRCSDKASLKILSSMVLTSFMISWSILGWMGTHHGQYSIAIYPCYEVLLPLWNVVVRVYTVLTLQKQFWGGVRLHPR